MVPPWVLDMAAATLEAGGYIEPRRASRKSATRCRMAPFTRVFRPTPAWLCTQPLPTRLSAIQYEEAQKYAKKLDDRQDAELAARYRQSLSRRGLARPSSCARRSKAASRCCPQILKRPSQHQMAGAQFPQQPQPARASSRPTRNCSLPRTRKNAQANCHAVVRLPQNPARRAAHPTIRLASGTEHRTRASSRR